jgi:hypothetical protein
MTAAATTMAAVPSGVLVQSGESVAQGRTAFEMQQQNTWAACSSKVFSCQQCKHSALTMGCAQNTQTPHFGLNQH